MGSEMCIRDRDDSRRLDALIKLLKSCISPRSANKNILPPRDTSRCWQTNCEEPLKCHKIVTVDFSIQSASITVPLQNSAVGFSNLVNMARSRLNSIFGDFFCAHRLAPNGGRAGAPSGAPVPCSGLLTLFGPPPPLSNGVGGEQTQHGVTYDRSRSVRLYRLCPPFGFHPKFGVLPSRRGDFL